MVTTLWNIWGVNTDTQKIINYMSWKRTAKQIVWEYFWLREELVYDDEWINVIDMINDFKDIDALTQKKVQYIEKLAELWVTEEMFNKLFNKLPDPSTFKVKLIDNTEENGKTNWGEQNNSWNTRKTKKK